ncbi:MAG: hypothetical protein IIA70_03040 [Proteobacteria bacterium]|nr:hypothetical protein [Pseudomonadota bacterium]
MKKNRRPDKPGNGNCVLNDFPLYSHTEPKNQHGPNIIWASFRFRPPKKDLKTSAKALNQALATNKARAARNVR